MSRLLSGLAAVALLALSACGGGMGKADLRVTDTKVVDCPDGTCVAATCVVTNVGISDGGGEVKVLWKGPSTEGEDMEPVDLRAGQSVDITRTFTRTDKGTRAQVKINCEVM